LRLAGYNTLSAEIGVHGANRAMMSVREELDAAAKIAATEAKRLVMTGERGPRPGQREAKGAVVGPFWHWGSVLAEWSSSQPQNWGL